MARNARRRNPEPQKGWASGVSRGPAKPTGGRGGQAQPAPRSDRLDHLAAGADVDGVPESLDVSLFRSPLHERREAPLGETVGRRDHRLATVLFTRFHFTDDAGAVLGIDRPVALHPDLREPDAMDRARFAVAELDCHADAADVVISVVRKSVLPREEALHRWQRNPSDRTRRGTLEEPECHSATRLLGHG